MGAERDRVAGFGRLEDGLRQPGTEWYRWGPYVSERQWGTVREDYSADGNAWDYLPHDQARSRAYRWGEDGLAGFCDIEQRLCLSLALWNGRDPILKERAFGLTGPQGNHGEDVKEYWWYLDAVPSHAWNRWRYHYPQGAFPYQDLIDTNAGRSRYQPEYELLDTGAFNDDRYWITEVHYAKAGPDDLLMSIQVTNAGPETETLHVLPTAWFRNTWSWGDDEPRPALRASGDRSVAIDHPFLGDLELIGAAAPGGADPQLLFCENETNLARLYGTAADTPYPKDGINDHVIHGAATVNPVGAGTKCAFWYQVTVPAGQTAELRLRLRPAGGGAGTSTATAAAAKAAAALGTDFDEVMTQRKAEAAPGDYEPTLAAATKNLGDCVEIRIRDNGIGISPEVKEKLFNPFFTTKPAGEGTGLGLSISHDIIVKQHSGSIEVDTRPGEFTEFRIVLPRAAVSANKPGGGGARACSFSWLTMSLMSKRCSASNSGATCAVAGSRWSLRNPLQSHSSASLMRLEYRSS